MGKRNTYTGYIRAHGSGDRAPRDQISAGVLPVVLAVSVADASQAATTLVGKALPAGAIVLGIRCKTGVTGGTTPTINVGLNFRGTETDDPDGLALNLPVTADAECDFEQNPGALLGTALLEDADITCGTGTGTAGTGGVTLYITYTFEDDGKLAS